MRHRIHRSRGLARGKPFDRAKAPDKHLGIPVIIVREIPAHGSWRDHMVPAFAMAILAEKLGAWSSLMIDAAPSGIASAMENVESHSLILKILLGTYFCF